MFLDLFGTPVFWRLAKDGDSRVFEIFKNHYSFYEYKDKRRSNPSYPNRKMIFGPGEKLCLITPDHKAIIGYRKFIDASGQNGVNCNFFRNEKAFNGEVLSSELLLKSEPFILSKWGSTRLYTYVNTKTVKGDGLCFKKAGWRKCGRTKTRNLLILEKYI